MVEDSCDGCCSFCLPAPSVIGAALKVSLQSALLNSGCLRYALKPWRCIRALQEAQQGLTHLPARYSRL